ncbi:Acg family FMN-binding oxidoreductase [Nocardia jiangsuensis]|uniref:Acg family FMN-binding oxidoreductase n=1 Tax=Nocardia jiangsuensis TaxID=1691563 RepID=A0ABV8DPF8_9NOCA
MADPDILARPDDDTVRAALRSASRAPSVHNTQPWQWTLDDVALHLDYDDVWQLSTADPRGRQMIISCGAALHHARTALADRGWRTEVTRMPDPEHPEHLATLRFRPWSDPPAGVHTRAAAMTRRWTDRLPMLPPPGPADLLHRLRMLASPHEVELNELDSSAGPRLAAASARVAILHDSDLDYQAELHWWVGHDGDTGVPVGALASDAQAAGVPLGRRFPAAPHSARRTEQPDQAAIIVLSTDGDRPGQWLRTGEALSAVLLECAAAGAASCTLTHLTELPAVRTMIAGLLRRGGTPQVLVRVGTAPDSRHEPTARRDLADILTIDRGHTVRTGRTPR